MFSLLLCACAANYEFNQYVTHLTSNNFQKEIEKRTNRTVYIVMFHGNNCPACREAYPHFDEAAENSQGMIKFGEIDTNVETALGDQFSILSIPTFIIFHPDGQAQFNRQRIARSFINAASRYIPHLATTIDETWLPSNSSRSVILFTDRQSSPPLWAAISCNYVNKSQHIDIGFNSNVTLQRMFKVTAVPTIMALNGNNYEIYNGKNKYSQIVDFINEFFSRNIAGQPMPTPIPELIQPIKSNESFCQVCKKHGIYCVIKGGSDIPPEYNQISIKYKHDPFKFYTCGSDCPYNYAKEGLRIIHPRREAQVIVDGIDLLKTSLDRVLDGSARFEPIPEQIPEEL